MNASTHTTRRFVSITGLAAVVAALAVPTALALPATDVGDDMSHTAVVLDLRSPDTSDVTTRAQGGVDPAIATAMASHQRRVTLGDFRSPDTRDVTVNPIGQDSPVAAPATSDGTNWGVIAAMLAAIGLLIAGVLALGLSGHGKRHGTMKPA